MNDMATSAPLVSVIIPAHNRAHTIVRAVHSVLSQTCRDIEVIVVDDASTDNTLSVVEAIGDPRVRAVRLERNQGAAGARNRGIDEATGTYVAFQDSDDEWLFDNLRLQVDAITSAGPEVGAVYGGRVVYGRDGAGVYGARHVKFVPGPADNTDAANLTTELMRRNFITPQALMARRAILRQIGGFDGLLRCNEDWDLALRLSAVTRLLYVDQPVVFCHVSDDSISRNRRRDLASRIRILGKLSCDGAVQREIQARHLTVTGYHLAKLSKPGSGARLIWRGLGLNRWDWRGWARLAACLALRWPPARRLIAP